MRLSILALLLFFSGLASAQCGKHQTQVELHMRDGSVVEAYVRGMNHLSKVKDGVFQEFKVKTDNGCDYLFPAKNQIKEIRHGDKSYFLKKLPDASKPEFMCLEIERQGMKLFSVLTLDQDWGGTGANGAADFDSNAIYLYYFEKSGQLVKLKSRQSSFYKQMKSFLADHPEALEMIKKKSLGRDKLKLVMEKLIPED